MAILIFFTSKPSLLLLNLNKKPPVYRKYLQKIGLLHLKIVSKLRNNLSSFFHHIKVYADIVPHFYSFTDMYCIIYFDMIFL